MFRILGWKGWTGQKGLGLPEFQTEPSLWRRRNGFSIKVDFEAFPTKPR